VPRPYPALVTLQSNEIWYCCFQSFAVVAFPLVDFSGVKGTSRGRISYSRAEFAVGAARGLSLAKIHVELVCHAIDFLFGNLDLVTRLRP
jgi:hypothetical protein